MAAKVRTTIYLDGHDLRTVQRDAVDARLPATSIAAQLFADYARLPTSERAAIIARARESFPRGSR